VQSLYHFINLSNKTILIHYKVKKNKHKNARHFDFWGKRGNDFFHTTISTYIHNKMFWLNIHIKCLCSDHKSLVRVLHLAEIVTCWNPYFCTCVHHVMLEWLAFVLCIWEVLDSNFDPRTGYPHWLFGFPQSLQVDSSKLVHDHFANPLQFIIY
jgi:hypothetical protein